MVGKINSFIQQPLPRQILFFDEMLTPKLIRLAYWLGLVLVLLSGLGRMFSHGFLGFFVGIFYIVLSVIVLRVIAELVMLLFKINKNIEVVAANTARPVGDEPAAAPVRRKATKKASKKGTKKKAAS